MKLTTPELEFLAAWAREEWEPACYRLPAHRLQLAHGVSGAELIEFIKAWTEQENKKDQEIIAAAANPQPGWPWPTMQDFRTRHGQASRQTISAESQRVRKLQELKGTAGKVDFDLDSEELELRESDETSWPRS